MIRAFIELNKKLSRSTDSLFVRNRGPVLLDGFLAGIRPDHAVADVGGGKQPVLARLDGTAPPAIYEGLDLDPDELERAPRGAYTAIHVVDITDPPVALHARYDRIICRSTLEHVADGPAAITGLSRLLKTGGQCYVKVPCRHAVFAYLNRLLPEAAKRRVLFWIFPGKTTDGFPALYEDCSLSRMQANGRRADLVTIGEPHRIYYASYFTFFFPLYAVWRCITALQYLVLPDYCETFEIIFHKEAREPDLEPADAPAQLATGGA